MYKKGYGTVPLLMWCFVFTATARTCARSSFVPMHVFVCLSYGSGVYASLFVYVARVSINMVFCFHSNIANMRRSSSSPAMEKNHLINNPRGKRAIILFTFFISCLFAKYTYFNFLNLFSFSLLMSLVLFIHSLYISSLLSSWFF